MRTTRLRGLAVGATLAASVWGCAPQTPDEAEAAKFPAAKPLSPAEAAKARELTQTRAPGSPPR